MQNYNDLTNAETERLAILIEECGEVIQAATKILRHGYESMNPKLMGTAYDIAGLNNRTDLEKEIGHVQHIISMMSRNGDIDIHYINRCAMDKASSIREYLHHQPYENNDQT